MTNVSEGKINLDGKSVSSSKENVLQDDKDIAENLTVEQINSIKESLEKEVVDYLYQLESLAKEEESLESILVKSQKEEDTLQNKRLELKAGIVYLNRLVTRCKELETLVETPESNLQHSFPYTKLPKFILASPWEDETLPKVVVCDGKNSEVPHRAFSQVFTPEQLERITKEKKWLALGCGRVQMQMAGVSGQVRVVSQNKDTVTTIVDTTEPEVLVGPCSGVKGKPGISKSCPKLKSNRQTLPCQNPTLTFSLTTSPPCNIFGGENPDCRDDCKDGKSIEEKGTKQQNGAPCPYSVQEATLQVT